MFSHSILIIFLSFLHVQAKSLNYDATDLQEKHINADRDTLRFVDTKETKEEIEKLISEKGLLHSLLMKTWDITWYVVVDPFIVLYEIYKYFLMIPKLIMESLRQTFFNQKGKAS